MEREKKKPSDRIDRQIMRMTFMIVAVLIKLSATLMAYLICMTIGIYSIIKTKL